MKITRSKLKELVKETMIEENEYQEFFKRALEKTGKSIPDMSDEEKKKFFDKVDAAWKAKGEKREAVEEESLNENPAVTAMIARQTKQMMDKKITNPKTKEKVRIGTAASNPSHPAYKQAKSILQRIRDKFSKKENVDESECCNEAIEYPKKGEKFSYNIHNSDGTLEFDVEYVGSDGHNEVFKVLRNYTPKSIQKKSSIYQKKPGDRILTGKAGVAHDLKKNSLIKIEESINEGFNIKNVLRKLGWAGESWTPKEFASQIKKLDDDTLKNWASSNKGIPNTPLAFQQKLVGIELKKRGLSTESVNEDCGCNENINEDSEYKTFFKKALEKTGKESITAMSDEEKKAFFNKVDAAWKAKGEKKEQVSEAGETTFYVFYNNKKHEFKANDLWGAKKQAIEKLKIPKSKQGLVAVMSKAAYDNEEFRFA
jgi:hypothetical protein